MQMDPQKRFYRRAAYIFAWFFLIAVSVLVTLVTKYKPTLLAIVIFVAMTITCGVLAFAFRNRSL